MQKFVAKRNKSFQTFFHFKYERIC